MQERKDRESEKRKKQNKTKTGPKDRNKEIYTKETMPANTLKTCVR